MSAPFPPPVPATVVADKLDALAAQLAKAAKAARADPAALGPESPQRLEIVEACKDVLNVSKTPMEEVSDRMTFLTSLPALRLFVKWKVFENIPANGTISYRDLAARVGADETLITRFSWVLVCAGILEQKGTDQVAHTPKSLIYTHESPLSAMMTMGFDTHLRSFLAMPAYFDEHGLKEPTNRKKCIFSFGQGEPDATMWEIINRHPDQLGSFTKTMVALENRYPLPGPYDFSWVVARGAEPGAADRVLVVDLGGNQGHALKAIVQATPGLDISRCALEDLDDVIEAVRQGDDKEIQKAKLVPVDFHTGQPIKGALVYYFRRCLHDYGDEDAAVMMQQVSRAMAPDSRLLVVELVIDNPPSPFAATVDFFMSTLGGKERTLATFTSLGERAGLKITSVNRAEGTDMSVIEYVKA